MVGVKEDKIREIAYKTFEITCYMFPLDEWEIEEHKPFELNDDSITALVEFEGAAVGGMYISMAPELLDAIAENMLGIEEADTELKEGALCEIANIICGNTVPVFAKEEKICYIRPPRIVEGNENGAERFAGSGVEKLQIYLDEGVAEITLYYSTD